MNTPLTQLQATLRERFPQAMTLALHAPKVPEKKLTWQPGKLLEVVADGAGSGPELEQLLATATQPAALIDGADALDPWGMDVACRERLLWARCRCAEEALRTADLLLRDGNVRSVLLDLRLLPRMDLLRLPGSVWHRLRLLAEQSGAGVLVVSPGRLSF